LSAHRSTHPRRTSVSTDFEIVGRLTAWWRARSLMVQGPAVIRIKLPICVGASGRRDLRISAATVRMTSMTTCRSSRAAV
jgi:hypothetical protein